MSCWEFAVSCPVYATRGFFGEMKFSEEFKRLGGGDGTTSGVPPVEKVLGVCEEVVSVEVSAYDA